MKALHPQQRFNFSFCSISMLVLFLFVSVFFFLLHSSIFGFELKEEKRVLILFGAQSDLPAYRLVEKGIKSSLEAGMEYRIEYFIEYMDSYRNADQTDYQMLLDLYRHRYSGKKIDLIIAFGAPMLNWVITHGNDLFPQTPVVFSGILQKQLTTLNLSPNVTGVLADIDFAGLLDTALKIHPQTRHFAIVNGASKTDLLFEKKIRESLEPYTMRFDFIYLTGLPLAKIAEKVQNLPEHTVILFYLLTRDGDGKGFPPWEAVSIVAKAANAPVYGCLETYFGHGIVGGRLSSFEMSGIKAGEIGLRIFRGEKASAIPMSGQGTIINLFDWRQFKRWGVHEDRLPPGSIVRFKTPSYWDLYRWHILAAVLVILVESVLISFLLRQRAQRRRAKAELAERLGFEEMLSGLSARFVNLPPDRVDQQIANELKILGEFLKMDRVTMFEASEINQKLRAVQSYTRAGVLPPPSQIEFDQLTWTRQTLFNGEPIICSDPDDLPAEAGAEKDYFHEHGIQSVMVIPFAIDRKTLGFLAFTMLQSRREWPDGLIRQCSLVAEVFANALARKQHEEERMQAEEKYRTVADFTYDWEYWANVDGTMEYTSPSCERISGYTIRDFKNEPSLFRKIIVPEDRDIWDSHYHDSRQELKPREIQFRIQRRDGQIRWIEHSCQPVTNDQSGLRGFRASNRDVTARKQVEEGLRQSKNFNRSILDSLNYHIAVLDREGNILDVNKSWKRFARENDAGLYRIEGVNYLEVCRQSADSGDELAQTALERIQSVLGGSHEHSLLEYPCDSPSEKRWFLMRTIPFYGRKGGVLISHIDITERKLREIDLRNAYTEIEQLKNKLEAETAYLQEEIKLEHDFESIIGTSAAIQYVLYKVEQVAATDTTVLVLGETGTGKELISRAIHNNSLRKVRPLVKVNCATLPSHLIESELFGHERGAFTGAHTRQMGRFEVADGTSIFLDEIGELPLELQTKLLRVIQDGEFERLGSPRTIKVDVRVIAATNRDLETEIRKGRFREDLFYRLNVFPITAPPLRDRTEDIPLLVEFFVEKVSKRMGKSIELIPERVMQKLQDYPWPGNVRELENVIERAVINSSGPKLRLADDLSLPVYKDMPKAFKSLEEIERDYITSVLEETEWRIDGPEGAALILDMNPSTLRSRLRKLGIKKP